MKQIYLDNSATTKVDKKVFEAMKPYFSTHFGNASSIHSFGQKAREAVDESRKKVADFLNCNNQEVIFTSGGSESNSLAIRGIIKAYSPTKLPHYAKATRGRQVSQKYKLTNQQINKSTDNQLPHIITSQIEHHAVLDTVRNLEGKGQIEATYIKPGKDGIIKVKDVKGAIKNNTILISIIYANNEVGTIQPIREIGKMVEKINAQRYKIQETPLRSPSYAGQANQRIFFHTDAVQAAGYLNMDVSYLHVDLLTMSAHKIYGPKGVGVLYVKNGTLIERQIDGGEQEYELRAGTENVPGIVGMAEAIKIASNFKSQTSNLKIVENLRRKLEDGLLQIPNTKINGCRINKLPNNVNISFKNAEGESILMMLDQVGIAASSGSACTSNSLEPSHVLSAIGIEPKWSHGSVRFSLGKYNTALEIDKVIKIMPKIIERLREISPIK